MPSRYSTSVHEAAHATVAAVLGVVPDVAEVHPTGSGSFDAGVCSFGGEAFKTLAPAERCAVFAAGCCAQRLILGERASHGENTVDKSLMRWATEDLLPEAWADFVRGQGVDLAHELVEQHRAAIVKLADALDQRGTMTGREIETVLRPFGVVRP
jgi:hypothetical protein